MFILAKLSYNICFFCQLVSLAEFLWQSLKSLCLVNTVLNPFHSYKHNTFLFWCGKLSHISVINWKFVGLPLLLTLMLMLGYCFIIYVLAAFPHSSTLLPTFNIIFMYHRLSSCYTVLPSERGGSFCPLLVYHFFNYPSI